MKTDQKDPEMEKVRESLAIAESVGIDCSDLTTILDKTEEYEKSCEQEKEVMKYFTEQQKYEYYLTFWIWTF